MTKKDAVIVYGAGISGRGAAQVLADKKQQVYLYNDMDCTLEPQLLQLLQIVRLVLFREFDDQQRIRIAAHGRLDHRPDRRLLDMSEHAQDDLAAPLQQAEDRRLLLRQRAAPRRTPQPTPARLAPLLATAAGLPLWPATT